MIRVLFEIAQLPIHGNRFILRYTNSVCFKFDCFIFPDQLNKALSQLEQKQVSHSHLIITNIVVHKKGLQKSLSFPKQGNKYSFELVLTRGTQCYYKPLEIMFNLVICFFTFHNVTIAIKQPFNPLEMTCLWS